MNEAAETIVLRELCSIPNSQQLSTSLRLLEHGILKYIRTKLNIKFYVFYRIRKMAAEGR